jgi:hypothetical protein
MSLPVSGLSFLSQAPIWRQKETDASTCIVVRTYIQGAEILSYYMNYKNGVM